MVKKLNGRVVVPKWYWKAVCDPMDKQSIFFWVVNYDLNYGKEGEDTGCFQTRQSKNLGVIQCSSLKEATSTFKKNFYIPAFNNEFCSPSETGANFKTVITKLAKR